MSSQDTAVGVTTGVLTIGATTCVGFTCGPYVNSVMFELLSGGTVTIVGVSTISATGYPLTSIPVTIGGHPTLFFNEKAGVTSTVAFIKTLNPPAEF